jgi:hypothetical protein
MQCHSAAPFVFLERPAMSCVQSTCAGGAGPWAPCTCTARFNFGHVGQTKPAHAVTSAAQRFCAVWPTVAASTALVGLLTRRGMVAGPSRLETCWQAMACTPCMHRPGRLRKLLDSTSVPYGVPRILRFQDYPSPTQHSHLLNPFTGEPAAPRPAIATGGAAPCSAVASFERPSRRPLLHTIPGHTVTHSNRLFR